LDFYSEDASKKDGPKDDWSSGLQLLGTADHYGVTDVEWDPSGRYLATSASAWQHTVQIVVLMNFYLPAKIGPSWKTAMRFGISGVKN
jgi:uncharacterized protein with WD repeat